MFNRCFWQHWILICMVIWNVHCNENQCVCKMCPQFSTPEAHCECCVWHFYGKRGIPDADVNIGSGSITPATAIAAIAAAHAASGDDNSFEDTPCRSDLYSNPDLRIKFSASLKILKQRLRCLLWLKKTQQRKQSSFFL